MESQDQKKTTPSAHESHGVHLCHRCGWPFPNPHPSAKHRRAHKRICGTIEGYKLTDSSDHIHSSVSDDENGSDEERPTPSPEIEKGSTSEISRGGVGEKSNRSKDEVFSDAVNEFSDKNVENVVDSDPGTKQQSKIDATAGIIHLPNSPTDSSQMHNLEVLKTETNLSGSAMPIEDIVLSCNSNSVVSSNKKTEGLAVVLDNMNGSTGDSSHIKSVNVSDAPKEDGEANVGDNEMQSLMVLLEHQTHVKGNEDSSVDVVSSDVAVTTSKTVSEAPEVACKLQETDQRPSVSVTVDQIAEPKEGKDHELGPMVSLQSLSPEVKSGQHMEVLVNAPQIESDSSQDRDVGSHSDSVESCCTNKERNGKVHVLSVANDIPVVDCPEIMVECFKDHNDMKLNLPVTLDVGEVNEPVVDDNKDTVYEENQSIFHLSNSGESIGISSEAAESHALKDNLKPEDGGNQVLVAGVPVEGEADSSELKNKGDELGSSGVEFLPMTTTSGEIQTDSHLEGQKPYDIPTDSSEDMLVESTKMGLMDTIPMAISAADEISDKTSINGGNNIHNSDKDQTGKCETDGKDVSEVVKEELSIHIERISESVDSLAVSKADQTANLHGAGNCPDHEKSGIEFSDQAENESRDLAVADVQGNTEINSKMTLESACNASESEVVDDGMDKVTKNLQETATTTNFVSDSSEVAPDASHWGIKAPTQSGSEIQKDDDSQEARKETKFNSMDEVLAETANPACMDAELNHNSGAESEKILENSPEYRLVEPDSTTNVSATVENNHCSGGGLGASGIGTAYQQEKGDENLTKQSSEVPAVDVSVDSSSQTDSLEGNWGSVSVLSTQSDALPASEAPAQSEKVNLQKPKTTSAGHRSNKSDVFDPPSFMTLVEPGDGNDEKAASSDIQTEQNTQPPKSDALQAGWFPSLTNVVNESQGRKKNEEIIAKVTNWSAGKQHANLKSLLGEANLETKPKSPKPKQTSTPAGKDESTTTANAIPVPEGHTDHVSKKEMGREWNSPARYPADDKKEKRKVKGRTYCVPFVCCSSVN